MKKLVFAGNWKMHVGPSAARRFMHEFLQRYTHSTDRETWFFPPAASIEAVADLVKDRTDIVVGAQNVYWEPKGAFTGEVSATIIREAGAKAALVGHSERRHVFGETDDETGKKVRVLLDAELTAVLCVGEKLEEREAHATLEVVERQLEAVGDLDADALGRIVVAYEPVWAIGTGKNATPKDAAEVHATIRRWLSLRGVDGDRSTILYGGSVKADNVRELISEDQVDGVLVGGASLDARGWAKIIQAERD